MGEIWGVGYNVPEQNVASKKKDGKGLGGGCRKATCGKYRKWKEKNKKRRVMRGMVMGRREGIEMEREDREKEEILTRQVNLRGE